jgi:predicted 3-demethylubiquinone-9 3-methyltransferase (glyoxalase superfamily)
VALNGGPLFRFTAAVSLFVTLEDEADVDRLWAGLADSGTVMMPLDRYDWSARYGWVADRWGLNWQVMLGKDAVRTVVPELMFAGDKAGKAEEALAFYASLFPGSALGAIMRHEAEGQKPGTVAHAELRLGDDAIKAMDNAGADFPFNEALSLLVECEDQAEVDRLWSALSAVPEAEACGWLKDRFGVSWQITPRSLERMMTSGDPAAVRRLTASFMKMKKLDLATLERAFAGAETVG